MNELQAKDFYKKQFDVFGNITEIATIPVEFVEEIIEQVGRDFTTVLELGAGIGALSRGLSLVNKTITSIELVPEMVDFAKKFQTPNVNSICGSFYDVELNNTFDAVFYMDGFGVGVDNEQVALLKRISNWLTDSGVGLIDIYHPNYWRKTSGKKMMPYPNSDVSRIYGFDESLNRMTDTWWDDATPEDAYTQSLACYSPEEIYDLCEKAGLKIIAYYPGGAMDFEKWKFNETVPLSECLSYRIKVIKA